MTSEILQGQMYHALDIEKVDCNTRNMVYSINCGVANCRQQYIGKSGRSQGERLSEHLRYVDKNKDATDKHFNLPGCSKWDIKATVLGSMGKSRERVSLDKELHQLLQRQKQNTLVTNF